MVEQGHQFIKKRVQYMLGLQSFQTTSTTLAGMEAMHIIKKSVRNQIQLIHTLFDFFSNLIIFAREP